jgi:hypothetical protein
MVEPVLWPNLEGIYSDFSKKYLQRFYQYKKQEQGIKCPVLVLNQPIT